MNVTLKRDTVQLSEVSLKITSFDQGHPAQSKIHVTPQELAFRDLNTYATIWQQTICMRIEVCETIHNLILSVQRTE